MIRIIKLNNQKESSGIEFIRTFLGVVNITYIPIIVFSVFILIFTCIFAGTVSPLFFFIVLLVLGLGILGLTRSKNKEDLIFTVRLFTFVFFFSIIVTCLIYFYYLQVFRVPYESGGTDDARFEYQADVLRFSRVESYEDAKRIIASMGAGTWNTAGNYTIVLALVKSLAADIGLVPHTLDPRLINGFFLAMTAVLVWKVTKYCTKNESTARFAGYYVGLLPSVVFTAAHIYRDMLIGFGLMLIIALTISLVDHFRYLNSPGGFLKIIVILGALIASWFLTASLRTGFLIIIAFMVGLMVIVQLRSPLLRVGLILLFSMGIFIASNNGIFNSFYSQAENYLDYYTNYRAGMGSESGIATGIYRLPPLISYPFRFVYASISPLPFPSPLISEDYRGLGIIIWYFSLPFLVSSLFTINRTINHIGDPIRRSVIVAFLVMYVTYAIVTLVARQITMYAPAGAILIALGIEESKGPLSKQILIMIILGVFMALMYAVVKII